MKELINLLLEGKIDEAYEGFKEIYEKKHNIKALYYLTLIEFESKKAPIPVICDHLSILYKKSNAEIKNIISSIYISILFFEMQDYGLCLQICEKEKRRRQLDAVTNYCYASCLFKKDKKNADRVLSMLNYSLDNDDSEPFVKLMIYEQIIMVYLYKNEIFNARQIFGKLTLLFPTDTRLFLIKAIIDMEEGIYELDQEALDVIINSDHLNDFIDSLYDNCERKHKLSLCIEILKSMSGKSIYDYLIQRKLAMCYFDLNRHQDVVDLFSQIIKKETGIDRADAYFILSEGYHYMGKIDMLIKAYHYAIESYTLEPNPIKLRALGSIARKLRDKEKISEVVSLIDRDYPQDKSRYLLLATEAIIDKEFDKAVILIAPVLKDKNLELEGIEILSSSLNNSKYVKKYCLKQIKNNEYRINCIANYYGKFGCKVNMDEKWITLLDNIKNKDNNDYSMLALFLLEKDYKKAIRNLMIGINRFDNNADSCTSCIGVYAKCLLDGVGGERNVEKAYNITLKAIKQYGGSCTNNVIITFAEACLELNKDLDNAYKYLIEYRNKKYNINWLYILIKLGKLLKKDVSNFELDYRLALKSASIREYEYYSKNPDKVMITNY